MCGPKAVLTEPESLDMVLSAITPAQHHVVVTAEDVAAVAVNPVSAEVLSAKDLFAKGGTARPERYQPGDVGDARDHVAFMAFSSGTSGLPKMVRLSDYSFTMTLLFM